MSVGALIGAALIALAAYILLAAAHADTASYGVVAIPGRATVELPKGESNIYYREGIDAGSGVSLVPPGDLQFSLSWPGGQSLRVDSRGGEPESVDGGTAQLIAAVDAPEKGPFVISADSTAAAQRIAPALTFGQSPWRAIRARAVSVWDSLRGPLGVAVVGVLVVLALLPSLRRARRGGGWEAGSD